MTLTGATEPTTAHRRRLRWWSELPLLAVVYALYTGARLLVRGGVAGAVRHGVDILHDEQMAHLDPEHWFNRLLADHALLGVPADFAYASLHYLVTPAVLVWVWRRRPAHYRAARTWLMLSTLIGLLGFTVLPTAPPRLLGAGHGFIDTMAQYSNWGWWGADASAPRGLGHLTNEYAAMPSLHVGWSLWCGVVLLCLSRQRWVRALGALYPLVTVLVVLGTANHYLMDAAAGIAVMGLGSLLTRPALRTFDTLTARWGTDGVRRAWKSRARPQRSTAQTADVTRAGTRREPHAAIPEQTPRPSASSNSPDEDTGAAKIHSRGHRS